MWVYAQQWVPVDREMLSSVIFVLFIYLNVCALSCFGLYAMEFLSAVCIFLVACVSTASLVT